MTQEKPTTTMGGEKCPFCAKGRLELCQTDHHVISPDEPEIIVAGVWVEKCDACNEMLFPSESSRYIEQYLAQATEQLTPAQLKEIRKRLGVDQTEMSEILGLGGRTYHRWEKGTQYPSRSMCCYIRILGKFPLAFKWLRDGGWRHEKMTVDHSPQANFEFCTQGKPRKSKNLSTTTT